MKKLILILSILLIASPIWAAIYHFNPSCSTNGDGSGQDCGDAFNGSASLTLASGDTLKVVGTVPYDAKRYIYGTLSGVTIEGETDQSSTYDGADTVPTEDWGSPTAGIYVWADNLADANCWVIVDDVPIRTATSASLDDSYCDEVGEHCYYKDSNNTYIILDGGAGVVGDHVVKIAKPVGVSLVNDDSVIIQDITMKNFFIGVLAWLSATDNYSRSNTIQRTIFNTMPFALRAYKKAPALAEDTPGWVIDNNTADYVGNFAVSTDISLVGYYWTDGSFSHNTITHLGQPAAGVSYSWTAIGALSGGGIYDTNDTEAFGAQNISGWTITGNNISGNATSVSNRGISIYARAVNGGTKGGTLDNIISRNVIDGTYSYGIWLGGDAYNPHVSGNMIFANLIKNQAGSSYAGVRLKGDPSASSWNVFVNNTLADNANGLMFSSAGIEDTQYWKIENNLIYGSTGYHVDATGVSISSDTNIIDYNSYYPDGAAKFAESGDFNFSGWAAAIGDQEAHSITADPELDGNYHIASDSPAKDAGTNPWSGDTSIHSLNGVMVWNGVSHLIVAPGGLIDIGAYEYTTGSTGSGTGISGASLN